MFQYQHCNLSCTIDLKRILSNIDDFKNIKQETFDAILDMSHIKEYNKETILYYENDSMKNICYLFHGYVKVFKINKFGNEVIIGLYINNCANFNVPPLINYHFLINDNYSNNIFCLENCRILHINAKELKEVIKKDQQLALNMFNRANKVIEEQEHIINLNMIYDAKARLASMIYRQPDIFHNLNKKTISQLLNMSQETLSRNLQKLKDDNIIRVENKHIEIIDSRKLRDIFEIERA